MEGLAIVFGVASWVVTLTLMRNTWSTKAFTNLFTGYDFGQFKR